VAKSNTAAAKANVSVKLNNKLGSSAKSDVLLWIIGCLCLHCGLKNKKIFDIYS